MNHRKEDLLSIRPQILSETVQETTGNDERFQNQILRPILKLQNDLLIEVFKNYANKHKGVFFEMSTDKKYHYIENAIQRDIKFRNSLKGIIIGQFTVEEYTSYIQNSSSLNKRMMNMVIERLKDQIQLFEVQSV
ncbi:glyoxalase [Zhouia sp. PK063]|uniref:glyoxalase n=1 Tax=Zhouia sp. PK063 TaxID=3373602 RepID=UPI0037ADBCB7